MDKFRRVNKEVIMLKTGIYDQIINTIIKKKLDLIIEDEKYIKKEKIEDIETSYMISNYLSSIIKHVIDEFEDRKENTTEVGIKLCNKIIDVLIEETQNYELNKFKIEEDSVLKAIFNKENFQYPNFDNYIKEIYPYSGLSQTELFTGCHSEISLESEIRKEIISSNEIYLLVSFIKWSGIRIFEKELRDFTSRGNKLKIITTTYMGATDYKAIEFLSSLQNTEIKVSYNTSNERLHAKAYIFIRDTGFHTSYIGSSNISRSALTSGLEWNIKVTNSEISRIIDKLKKTFEAYWENSDFVFYEEAHKEKLQIALKNEDKSIINKFSTFFDIKPYSFQEEILEQLETQRQIHNRYKNLLVAATGTGKTIVSAFDYKRFKKENKSAKLLFVAHRKEILLQSRDTFRAVLKDYNFGDLWFNGESPSSYEAVFASVQTLANNIETLRLSKDFYDFVIIDEVHHIAADSYRPILDKFTPKILLGLTATPERMDNEDILIDFGGVISAEIRLTEALNRKLLCPFQYFGVTDNSDLRSIKWQNGKYSQSELTNVFNRDDRVLEIITACEKYLNDINNVRALCFCVTREHAQFMSESFQKLGFKANYLVSNNAKSEVIPREQVKEALISRKINFLFVVDIYNEGVDIPEIDTILFLRPTESLTIFLQQFGRGLRFAEDKENLTVLDFVGNAREEYDYESKLRSLIGKTSRSVSSEIENNFPHLPSGCSIILERQAKEYILNNIKKAILIKRDKIVNRIINYKHHTNRPFNLHNFLNFYNIKIEDLYKRDTFTMLCYEAKIISEFNTEYNTIFHRMFYKKLLSCRSLSYYNYLLELCDKRFIIDYDNETSENKLFLMMLYYDFWQEPRKQSSFENSIKILGENEVLLSEMKEILLIQREKIDYIEKNMELPYVCPIKLHSFYTRDQIISGFGRHTYTNKFSSREGVLNISELNTELLFVTLNKEEDRYSPSTMYEDYAINKTLFHWQSQNSTREDSPKGQSYINHKKLDKKIILFVREANNDSNKNTMPYLCLGKVNYKSHSGEQPMSIIWELEEEIPAFYTYIITKMEIG